MIIYQINDHNTTDTEIITLTQKQELIYKQTLEKALHNKNLFLKKPKPYQQELLILGNNIKRNQAKNDEFAVLRDEVLMKSYQILQIQNKMTRHILRALDLYDFQKFDADMNERFIENQIKIQEVDIRDYKPFLELKDNSRELQEAQKNIKDYYALIAINADMLKYYSIFERRMYRLNKYANYHILPLAIYLDHSKIGEMINPILYPYNLSLVKFFLIIFISLFIFLFRRQFYRIIELVLSKIKYLERYSKDIIDDIYKVLNVLFFIVNLNIIIYIYNNFNTPEISIRAFNIIYTLLFIFIFYRMLNTIASISILEIGQEKIKIKSEMVNVSLKIINFIIVLLGLLLVLHFAGANLTTVLSGLGIGGFAVAFAAKETLANFLGTISILMSDVFSQGDWIVVDDKEGIVVEIGLRVTTLRTFANGLISIPNGIIANRDITNWSRRTLGRRIKMSLGIKYDSKPGNISTAVEEIREMLKTHPNIATTDSNFEQNGYKKTKLVSKEDSLGVKRMLLVYVDELADSSINILVYCFSKNTDWKKWLETKEDIIYKMMAILEKNNLEFAYPSMSIYPENKD